ncbi:hypothetical protein HWV62_21510 [Athelia sp. TMB]|nr:hypothetical protein HWV62_21510 [Athelia sp. TMB]
MSRSVSESVAYSPPSKRSGFSIFSRRKKNSSEGPSTTLPPPTPPKDKPYTPQPLPQVTHGDSEFAEVYPAYVAYDSPHNSSEYHREDPSTHVLAHYRGQSTPDIIHFTHNEADLVVIEPYRSPALEAKWAAEPFAVADPAERAKRRMEARRKKEEEERRAVEEEDERQRLLKLRKQAILDQEEEEELMRRSQLEHEMRQATAERVRRVQAEQEEEAMKAWELAERKRVARERRADHTRQLELWRAEEQKRKENIQKRKEEGLIMKDSARRARIQAVEMKIRKNSTTEMVTGWLSVQVSDAPVLQWKRRFFKVSGSNLALFRSPQDMSQALDIVDLGGRVSALKESYEGYEELEAIPHAFALEFTDGSGPWSFFCDTEEDKAFILITAACE